MIPFYRRWRARIYRDGYLAGIANEQVLSASRIDAAYRAGEQAGYLMGMRDGQAVAQRCASAIVATVAERAEWRES